MFKKYNSKNSFKLFFEKFQNDKYFKFFLFFGPLNREKHDL